MSKLHLRNWVGFLILAAYWAMLWLHYRLGLTDALMRGAGTPWGRVSLLFNLVMVGVFSLGMTAYQIDALWLFWLKRDKVWLCVRYLVLAVHYAAIQAFDFFLQK